jgi:hypothetical protein
MQVISKSEKVRKKRETIINENFRKFTRPEFVLGQ